MNWTEAMLISDLEAEESYEPTYNFSITEDVLFEVNPDEYTFVYVHLIDNPTSSEEGSASHEKDYGCLDYMISECMRREPFRGFYVLEGASVDYTRGDGWTTDDDADLYFEELRPARLYEIREALGENPWRHFFRQLRLHLLHTWGFEF